MGGHNATPLSLRNTKLKVCIDDFASTVTLYPSTSVTYISIPFYL